MRPFLRLADEQKSCVIWVYLFLAIALVHLIDREGDSIGHIRLWEATGSHWLVRVKDNPKVDYEGKAMACKAVAQELAFIKTRQVSYHAKTYWQWVAETEVTLTRPARLLIISAGQHSKERSRPARQGQAMTPHRRYHRTAGRR